LEILDICQQSRRGSRENWTGWIGIDDKGLKHKEKYAGEVIQIPVIHGTVKSTNHKSNVLDLIKYMYPKATTLADIGITKVREEKILQVIAESLSVPQSNPDAISA
jgi:hypothetical protein